MKKLISIFCLALLSALLYAQDTILKAATDQPFSQLPLQSLQLGGTYSYRVMVYQNQLRAVLTTNQVCIIQLASNLTDTAWAVYTNDVINTTGSWFHVTLGPILYPIANGVLQVYTKSSRNSTNMYPLAYGPLEIVNTTGYGAINPANLHLTFDWDWITSTGTNQPVFPSSLNATGVLWMASWLGIASNSFDAIGSAASVSCTSIGAVATSRTITVNNQTGTLSSNLTFTVSGGGGSSFSFATNSLNATNAITVTGPQSNLIATALQGITGAQIAAAGGLTNAAQFATPASVSALTLGDALRTIQANTQAWISVTSGTASLWVVSNGPNTNQLIVVASSQNPTNLYYPYFANPGDTFHRASSTLFVGDYGIDNLSPWDISWPGGWVMEDYVGNASGVNASGPTGTYTCISGSHWVITLIYGTLTNSVTNSYPILLTTGSGALLTGITAAQVGAVATNDARYLSAGTNVQLNGTNYAAVAGTFSLPTIAGPQGPAGANGTNGAQGATGPQGIQGIQGVPGTSGTNGAQGIQGPQGIQGVAGTSGTNGAQGATGPQGPASSSFATNSLNATNAYTVTGPQSNLIATALQGITGAQIAAAGGLTNAGAFDAAGAASAVLTSLTNAATLATNAASSSQLVSATSGVAYASQLATVATTATNASTTATWSSNGVVAISNRLWSGALTNAAAFDASGAAATAVNGLSNALPSLYLSLTGGVITAGDSVTCDYLTSQSITAKGNAYYTISLNDCKLYNGFMAYSVDWLNRVLVGTWNIGTPTGNGSQLTGITAAQVGAVGTNDARYLAALTNAAAFDAAGAASAVQTNLNNASNALNTAITAAQTTATNALAVANAKLSLTGSGASLTGITAAQVGALSNNYASAVTLATNVTIAGSLTVSNAVMVTPSSPALNFYGMYQDTYNELSLVVAGGQNIRLNQYGQLIVSGQLVASTGGDGLCSDRWIGFTAPAGQGRAAWIAGSQPLVGPTMRIESNLYVVANAVIAGSLAVSNGVTGITAAQVGADASGAAASASNGAIAVSAAAIIAATNGLVTASITNGLASVIYTTNLVTTATNGLLASSVVSTQVWSKAQYPLASTNWLTGVLNTTGGVYCVGASGTTNWILLTP